MYIIAAILIFGVLIAVHELGHFLAAKACGVRVNEFSIGMGPTLSLIHISSPAAGRMRSLPSPLESTLLRKRPSPAHPAICLLPSGASWQSLRTGTCLLYTSRCV